MKTLVVKYEAVIGLEVHVQLKTRSKVFASVGVGFGEEPNTLTDPVIMGLPGVLPVLNEEAVRQAVRAGLILGSEIPEVCKWDRKQYFYPDSPKNYQLTQYDEPVCVGGAVEIELPGPARNIMGEHRWVRLTRAHLEEDVGKLTHAGDYSLVDYNRAGTPLLEIVTEPDIYSSAEAVAFLNALRMLLTEAGVSDCDMEKGQMRCDANISVRPVGSTVLNSRTEIKNLNSITGVRQAIDYEIRRQTGVYAAGGQVVQETRRWDAEGGLTTSMRGKEEAHDYRYFPDPDLLPVRFPPTEVEALRAALPERVFERQRRYQETLDLPYTLTSVICYDFGLARYFEEALAAYSENPKALANYIANELQRERGAVEGDGLLPLEEVAMRPADLADLVRLIDAGHLTKQAARTVFVEMFQTGEGPAAIADRLGLKAEPQDSGALEAICREVIAANPVPAAQFREGNAKAINAYVGPIMKATQGKANPREIHEILARLVAAD